MHPIHAHEGANVSSLTYLGGAYLDYKQQPSERGGMDFRAPKNMAVRLYSRTVMTLLEQHAGRNGELHAVVPVLHQRPRGPTRRAHAILPRLSVGKTFFMVREDR